MPATPSAITTQEDAVSEILSAPPQGKRAASHGMTLLNRNPRVLSGIRSRMAKRLARCGYTDRQAEQAWADVKDMAQLEAGAH